MPEGVGKWDCAGNEAGCFGKVGGGPGAGLGTNLGPVAGRDVVNLGTDGAGGGAGDTDDGKSLRCFMATHGRGTGTVSSGCLATEFPPGPDAAWVIGTGLSLVGVTVSKELLEAEPIFAGTIGPEDS